MEQKKFVGCLVLSDLLCEKNRIWRIFGGVITKKIIRQILGILLK